MKPKILLLAGACIVLLAGVIVGVVTVVAQQESDADAAADDGRSETQNGERAAPVETKPQLSGAAPGSWTMDYEAALELATKEKRPLFLNFTGSDWCGYCIKMDHEVFSKETWRDYAAANLVLVTLDFPSNESLVPDKYKKRNETLRQKYDVEGYPTYVVLTPGGDTELGRLGAEPGVSAADFVRKVVETLRFSDASVARIAAMLPAEQGQQYRDAIDSIRKETESMEAWISSRPRQTEENFAKLQTFMKRIEQYEQDAERLELEGRLRALAGELAPQYRDLMDKARRMEGLADELNENRVAAKDWLFTQMPAPSAENEKKLAELMDRINASLTQLGEL